MRIGIDGRFWNESGVGRYTRNLVAQLREIDRENEYVLFVLSEVYEDLEKEMGNRKWKIVRADIRWHSVEEQIGLPKILNEENLDLMHFPYFSVPILYNKPFIVTIHDLILHHFPTGEASTLPSLVYRTKHAGYKFVIKEAARKAKKVITVSHATENELVKQLHIPREKIVVTYEGVEVGYRGSEIVNRRILDLEKDKYFLHVGNLYPHKNMNRLLEAFATVIGNRESGTGDMKLVIVGKEDYFYRKFEKLVREKSLEKSVAFLGKVSDEELMFLYHHALSAVVPSLMEGFGLPAAEAMRAGCLVLASDTPALKEICGDTAIYVDPLNISDMTEKLREIYLSPKGKYDTRVRSGLVRAKQFSWTVMAKQTIQIYESCIGI